MRSPTFAWPALAVLLAAVVAGCSAGPPPGSPATPPPTVDADSSGMSFGRLLSGSADSVGAIPGSAGALYYYRFKQIEPGSDRFVFQDRELSFYFRPTPDALFFQVENRTDKPVWLDWDKCTFFDPLGSSSRAAHSSTQYRDRFGSQPATQIPGLQRYSDHTFPIDYMFDPSGSDRQIHRALLPEDENAPQFFGREFGVDLAFRVENQPRSYSFRFRVASVIPNH